MIWFREFWLMSVAFFLKIWSGKECEVEGFWNGLRPQTVDLLWLKRPIVLLMCLASGAGVLQKKHVPTIPIDLACNMWNIQSQLLCIERYWEFERCGQNYNPYPHLYPSTSIDPWDVLMRLDMHGCIRKSQTTGVKQRIEWINPEDVQKFKIDLVPKTYFILF